MGCLRSGGSDPLGGDKQGQMLRMNIVMRSAGHGAEWPDTSSGRQKNRNKKTSICQTELLYLVCPVTSQGLLDNKELSCRNHRVIGGGWGGQAEAAGRVRSCAGHILFLCFVKFFLTKAQCYDNRSWVFVLSHITKFRSVQSERHLKLKQNICGGRIKKMKKSQFFPPLSVKCFMSIFLDFFTAHIWWFFR